MSLQKGSHTLINQKTTIKSRFVYGTDPNIEYNTTLVDKVFISKLPKGDVKSEIQSEGEDTIKSKV